MRVSQEEMDKNHKKIVEGAARLVKERGIENTSVSDVMCDAGLTHGGFYRHFKTKEALMAAAIQESFEQVATLFDAKFAKEEPAEAITAIREYYLSKGHLENPGKGCIVPTLGSEVGRGADALKIGFGAGVNRMIATLAKGMTGTDAQKRAKATREFSMMVGAMIIARASDPETARRVLAAAKSGTSET